MKNFSIMLLLAVSFLWGAGTLTSNAVDVQDVEITLEASINKSVYIGQAAEFTITLRSNIPDVADIRMVKAPQFPGDVDVIKGVVKNSKGKEESIKGKKYYTWTIVRDFLIPKEGDKLSISSSKFIAFIPKEKVVNDFFWGMRRVIDYEEVPVECKGTDFKAERLPEKNAPADFSSCVGEFNVEGWFPPGEIIVGRDALVTFTISGYGDLSNLKLGNISEIFKNGCALKEIEREDSRSQKEGRLFSEVTLVCKFIPETEDGFISPLTFTFFNPAEKKYEKVSSYTMHWNGNSQKKPSGKIEAVEI